MSAATFSTTDGDFAKDVLSAESLIVVDFWAEWCGPCRALAPKLEELAVQYSGKMKVYKLDIDSNQDTPSKFGVRGVPTLIVFKGGRAVEQIIGNHPKENIEAVLKRHL